MENLIQIVGVPVITAMVYGAIEGYKLLVVCNEKCMRIIPIIGTLLGIALGIVAYYAVESVMPADNLFAAILIGGASGLAATGSHQIFKQIGKCKDDSSNDKKTLEISDGKYSY